MTEKYNNVKDITGVEPDEKSRFTDEDRQLIFNYHFKKVILSVGILAVIIISVLLFYFLFPGMTGSGENAGSKTDIQSIKDNILLP